MRPYPLRYTLSGHIFIQPEDDCEALVDSMLAAGYREEFCISTCLESRFAARLMRAGFLVMSIDLEGEMPGGPRVTILLPKLHVNRSVLFFEDLHIKRSVRPLLGRYELRFDEDFDLIVRKCLAIHGEEWLTSPLVRIIRALRQRQRDSLRPVSFGVYRNGELQAGEFGILCGRVYTSYSGYYEEDNAGTVQMILMCRYLQEQGFEFLDFGMPLEYKDKLGARNIGPEDFVPLFRRARDAG